MMRLIRLFVLLCGTLLTAPLFAAGTATVVCAHPWLTRGVDHESLIGIRFSGEKSYGGALNSITFQIDLKGCTRAAFSDIHLWIQPGPAYSFYEPTAIRLAKGTLTATANPQEP